ncbi:MAG: pyridoxamine 5'-phosphate oxidase [Rhodospirillales bacterium]|nr:pyridoxamine 5'-phosphate oxidase [Rhodospirillales bacterium]
MFLDTKGPRAVTNDPIVLFREWLAEAEKSEPDNPTAVALATVGADGAPSVRMVLLKGIDERGFVFYTNLGSRKAAQIGENARVGLCFHWKSLARQVTVEGLVAPVGDAEADAYFASRDRGSRIGAWASKQSQPLEGRFELEKRVAKFAAKFHVGTVPRPEFWSGFRVVPERIEFWQDRKSRLHDRSLFTKLGDAWQTVKLFP